MNNIQKAAEQIAVAIEKLKHAQRNLRNGQNLNHFPVSVSISNLTEVLNILNDPECTPEITGSR